MAARTVSSQITGLLSDSVAIGQALDPSRRGMRAALLLDGVDEARAQRRIGAARIRSPSRHAVRGTD